MERALHDADTTVALAAAYGLQRANRKDVIENNLVARIDEGANEIRRVLELLETSRSPEQLPRQIGGIFLPKYSAMTCCAIGAATLAP